MRNPEIGIQYPRLTLDGTIHPATGTYAPRARKAMMDTIYFDWASRRKIPTQPAS
jgi:hypothetical protein